MKIRQVSGTQNQIQRICGTIKQVLDPAFQKPAGPWQTYPEFLIHHLIVRMKAYAEENSSSSSIWPMAYVLSYFLKMYPQKELVSKVFLKEAHHLWMTLKTSSGQANLDKQVGALRLFLGGLVKADLVSDVWNWWADFLNAQSPPTLTSVFYVKAALETSGSYLLKKLPTQAPKLWAYVRTTFLTQCRESVHRSSEAIRPNLDLFESGLSSLSNYLKTYQASGQLPPSEGYEITDLSHTTV